MIGYGSKEPKVVWPNNAKLALQIVLNYEEGSENNILPPMAKIIATNSDKITIKLLTPLAIFCVFCLANQDNNKNVMTKIIIPVITIFI